MAERRMFAKTVIDSDAFMDMPLSTQALYFHLSMGADDDGFVNNPKKIQRMIGCGEDDLKLLIAKEFIIPFASGVVVITHWKMHNYIKNDRYKETVYQEEKSMLGIGYNKAYLLMEPNGIQSGSILDTQDRIEIDEDRIELGKIRRDLSSSSSSSSLEEDDPLSTAQSNAEVDASVMVESYGVPVRQSDYAIFQRMTNQYMKQYWDAAATDNDYCNVFELTRKRILLPNGEAAAAVDSDKQALLERALYITTEKGRQGMNWSFVRGILHNWEQLGLTTIDQIEEHEYNRSNRMKMKGRY